MSFGYCSAVFVTKEAAGREKERGATDLLTTPADTALLRKLGDGTKLDK